MSLHLVNLIKDRIGELFLPYIHPEFVDHDGCRILAVRCERGPKPAFVKDGAVQRFFVRGANATAELTGQSIVDYTTNHFKRRASSGAKAQAQSALSQMLHSLRFGSDRTLALPNCGWI
jgi:hypothetical protein